MSGAARGVNRLREIDRCSLLWPSRKKKEEPTVRAVGVGGKQKPFNIVRLEIRNASVAMESPELAVGLYGHGGSQKMALPTIPLKGGEDKTLMRFEIGAKAKVPDDGDSVLFFTLKYKAKGKEQPPKYWSFISVSKLSGQVRLPVYKAPIEYVTTKQKLVVKKDCFLVVSSS